MIFTEMRSNNCLFLLKNSLSELYSCVPVAPGSFFDLSSGWLIKLGGPPAPTITFLDYAVIPVFGTYD